MYILRKQRRVKKMKISKSVLIKDTTHTAWKNLGTAKTGEISKEYARIVLNSTYPEDLKVELLAALSRFGWNLKTLAKEGYGYNTASGGKWTDSAGKLNAENHATMWVYT